MNETSIPHTLNGGAQVADESNGAWAGSARAEEPGGTLTERDVEAIADATARKVLDAVREPAKVFGLVGARELAEALGVSLHYVYAHAIELGAMRLGSGPKARIRFDLDKARRALEERSTRSTAPGRHRRRGPPSAAGF